MNASAYRNSEVLKKPTKSTITPTNVPPPPSTTVKSLKSDTPRPGTSKSAIKDEQNGHHTKMPTPKNEAKRKSNGHPPSKPGTSAAVEISATTKIPLKKRKIEAATITPQKVTCPMDLIMDEMNNLESQKRKTKKKEESDSESIKGLQKAATPLPGTFKAPTYLDLLRIESDNSMVFEFLNKRVPSVCEMVLAYKMLRGRVDNFNLTYFDRTKIKNIQNHIPPDAEVLHELRGPEVFFDTEEEDRATERKKGPRTPSGSPPSPTPPPEEKTTEVPSSMPAGFIPDMDQSAEAQEQRRIEVKKYLAKRVNKDIKDVEGMLTEDHWKLMGALKKELMFAMIDQMVEAATNTSSNIPEGLNSTAGNSARNSVAMDISSNSSSINEKLNRSKNTTGDKVVVQPSASSQIPNVSHQPQQQYHTNVTNLVTSGFQIYASPHQQQPQQSYQQHSYPPPPLQQQQYPATMPNPTHSLVQQQILSPQKVQPQQTFQIPSHAASHLTIYPSSMQEQPPTNFQKPPPQQQQQYFQPPNPSAVQPIQQSPPPSMPSSTSQQPRFTPLPNSTTTNYFSSFNTATPRLPSPGPIASVPHTSNTPHPASTAINNTPPALLQNNNFNKKQNKRGGIKMNKSQKRFQEFNNQQQPPQQSQQTKGLDPKFAKLDMDLIRSMPPPPIPKIIQEENQKKLAAPQPLPSSATSTYKPPLQPPPSSSAPSYRAPLPNIPSQQQQQPPPSSASVTNRAPFPPPQHPPNIPPPQRQQNNVEIPPTRLPPPPAVVPRPDIRPNVRPDSFSSPQRPHVPTGPPPLQPSRMNVRGPFPTPPPQQHPSSNMQRPPFRPPSMPTPDSSSVMRTLFSALNSSATSSPQQPPIQMAPRPQMPPPPRQFRHPMNPNFMPPRMPMHRPPRFRPRR